MCKMTNCSGQLLCHVRARHFTRRRHLPSHKVGCEITQIFIYGLAPKNVKFKIIFKFKRNPLGSCGAKSTAERISHLECWADYRWQGPGRHLAVLLTDLLIGCAYWKWLRCLDFFVGAATSVLCVVALGRSRWTVWSKYFLPWKLFRH